VTILIIGGVFFVSNKLAKYAFVTSKLTSFTFIFQFNASFPSAPVKPLMYVSVIAKMLRNDSKYDRRLRLSVHSLPAILPTFPSHFKCGSHVTHPATSVD
jgi:hypothetical protein